MKKFGHYEVTAELGRGGMGVVYKGWEPSLNRQVAIKALGEHLLNDKDLVERFTREAKATAALNNPNVIQIYFIGEEQGQPYFAMEYIEGQSLDDILKGGYNLSVKHAKNILKQACLGLSAAHKIDLVHRDIKPANIMLTHEGTLKIVDFGIARTREYGDKLTNTGEFVGTPGYLSPEVCVGKEVDERSDIFSLGIVFYEMLAGKVPFENDSPLGLMLEVVQSEIPDIRALNKKVDKKTSFILNKMIAKLPEERYQNCSEIIRDIGSVIENQSIENIKKERKPVKFAAKKSNISQQVTLQSEDIITATNIKTQSSKGSKKWLLAATVFAMAAAAGFGYVNGYLPIPKSKISTLVQSTSLPDQETLADNTAGSDSTSETQSSTEVASAQDSSLALAKEDASIKEEDVLQVEEPQPLDLKSMAEETTLASSASMSKSSAEDEIPEDLSESDKQTEVLLAETRPISTPLIASVDKTSKQIAEAKNTHPLMTASQSASTSQNASQNKNFQSPSKVAKKAIALNKGVVVIAFGDPAIANPVEKILESELKQHGIKVMNEQFIPGMRQLVNNGLDLAELKNLIQSNGGQAMIIANVNFIGTQTLQYGGRSSELVNAQLDVETYDIKTGNSIGTGFGAKINYTSLNATDQASDAIMQFTDRLTHVLKEAI